MINYVYLIYRVVIFARKYVFRDDFVFLKVAVCPPPTVVLRQPMTYFSVMLPCSVFHDASQTSTCNSAFVIFVKYSIFGNFYQCFTRHRLSVCH
jgi:hypothetical protein